MSDDHNPVPRPEYPRPQFVRPDWLCLNGLWQFEIDQGDSGWERGLVDRNLAHRIIVPFCPESPLSNINNTDFLRAVWYRREVSIPKEWEDRRILLHFQAVDHDATVWVNGSLAARHRGGFTPFQCDITDYLTWTVPSAIVVRVRDIPNEPQARGKQARKYNNHGVYYTRTTGIWQTVWLEPVPQTHFRRPRITPLVGANSFYLQLPLSRSQAKFSIHVELSDNSGAISSAAADAAVDLAPQLFVQIPQDHIRYWEPADPFLYNLKIQLKDQQDNIIDEIDSYAGLRSISIDGRVILLNGKPFFQRLVLDQGYYPDGVMTAPDDAALLNDIELSINAGFNGARLHQKVFEERFLYHADKLGYIVWGEFGDWGCETTETSFADWGSENAATIPSERRPDVSYLSQWHEVLERDYSHPCIIGWCPLNETADALTDQITPVEDVTRALFLATKAADMTRLVLDASGYSHRVAEADVYDSHVYVQDPKAFKRIVSKKFPYMNGPDLGSCKWSIDYNGQPYLVSEFGGIWWDSANGDENSWGYGPRLVSIEEFYERFSALVEILSDDPRISGYCYTQLTDVFQERNGIYAFDRTPKFDVERIRAIQSRKIGKFDRN